MSEFEAAEHESSPEHQDALELLGLITESIRKIGEPDEQEADDKVYVKTAEVINGGATHAAQTMVCMGILYAELHLKAEQVGVLAEDILQGLLEGIRP